MPASGRPEPRRSARRLLALAGLLGWRRSAAADARRTERPSVLARDARHDALRPHDRRRATRATRRRASRPSRARARPSSVAYAPAADDGAEPRHALHGALAAPPRRRARTASRSTRRGDDPRRAPRRGRLPHRRRSSRPSWSRAASRFDQGFGAFDDALRARRPRPSPRSSGRAEARGRLRPARRRDHATARSRWLEANGRARSASSRGSTTSTPTRPTCRPRPSRGASSRAAGADALARDVARYDEEIAFADAELARAARRRSTASVSQRTPSSW